VSRGAIAAPAAIVETLAKVRRVMAT
jgi:hypothetical protein